MKDKRQRIAVAWPYAAVYADPTFAASLLQAAANSVGMPYGYAPNPMIPQMPVIAPQIQQSAVSAAAAANHYYGYRYAPYPIPQRNPTAVPPHAHSHAPQLSTPPNGALPHASYPSFKSDFQNDIMQSPASPLSSLSLSPTGSDKMSNPLKSDVPLNGGLLMTAAAQIKQEQYNNNHSHHTSVHHQVNHHNNNNNNCDQTTLIKSEKPKLFKPYKSEE